eukprot:jgi/Botrbrau1/15411/Bobra.43_2s0037.1
MGPVDAIIMNGGRYPDVSHQQCEDDVKRLFVNRIRTPSFTFGIRTPIKDHGNEDAGPGTYQPSHGLTTRSSPPNWIQQWPTIRTKYGIYCRIPFNQGQCAHQGQYWDRVEWKQIEENKPL